MRLLNGADGGAEGDRTLDLRLAKPALSQLSYSPAFKEQSSRTEIRTKKSFAHRSEAMKSGPAWTRTTDLCVISTAL